MDYKYLSILTNFGCHFECSYCVTKKHGIAIPQTTSDSLDRLGDAIRETGANIISVSGGGDPLYKYTHHYAFYEKLWRFCRRNRIPLEMHTSYVNSHFNYGDCFRVVYHIRRVEDLVLVKRHGGEIVRVVFVVTKDFTEKLIDEIYKYVSISKDIDELSFRQMIDENYEPTYYCYDHLKKYHRDRWWYIEQDDYNLYYVNGEIVDTYKTLARKAPLFY
jgi:organic radical activating enzyme